MHIGGVAERSGVSAKTIRYYESIGLIPSTERTQGGYRIYDEVDLRTLQFIKRARSLPVNDVAELLALWRDRDRTSAEVKRLAQMRITHIEGKLEELQAIRRALLDLAEQCQGDVRPDCPIIDGLAGSTH